MRGMMTVLLSAVMALTATHGAPVRVALLDFENQATASDAAAFGGVTPAALADKGVSALSRALVNKPDFVLVDRRDFVRRMQPLATGDRKDAVYQPSFLQAAQAVNADLVLRGALLSYAPGKQSVNLGGIRTEFTTLSIRVALEALDTADGTVVAAVDGAARREFRQTESLSTVVGEDELLELLQNAIANAVPQLEQSLQARRAAQQARPRVNLSVRTSADPALVELNGMLIGTTPLDGFKVYAGDHVLTVGKAGYRDVSKRVHVGGDMLIEVPLIRTELTADEIKEILEKSRLNIVSGVPESALMIHQLDADIRLDR